MSEIPVHSKLSPSSASRWTSCTASIYLAHLFKLYKAAKTKKAKDAAYKKVVAWLPSVTQEEFAEAAGFWEPDKTSIYADEGTEAHDYAEKILRGTMNPKDLPEGFECVMEYVDVCRTLHNRWGGEMFVESRVPLFYFPEERGTVDNAIFGGEVLCITDYKHGIGVIVEPEGNKQLTGYGLSFVKHYEISHDLPDDHRVEIRIVQPRTKTGDTEKLWDTTVGELKKHGEFIQEQATLILDVLDEKTGPEELKFVAGKENCQFCSCKEICFYRNGPALEAILELVEDVDIDVLKTFEREEFPLIDFKLLTSAQIFGIWRHSDMLKAILSGCGKWLLEQAIDGNPVPGTKLVSGRMGNRAWLKDSEDEIAEKLLENLPEEEIYKKKLQTPTQIKEMLRLAQIPKEDIAALEEQFIRRSPGRPVLALESDKRPALSAGVDAFEGIEDADSEE